MDSKQFYVSTDWLRSLRLLRDSFADRLEKFTIVAPRLDMVHARPDQQLQIVDSSSENISIIPSMDMTCGKRGYWLRERSRWRTDVKAALQNAEVIHTGLSDLYRPINLDAFNVGVSSGKVNIFARDTDEIAKIQQLAESDGRQMSLRERLYAKLYFETMKYCVRKADLSLLKGDLLYNRYKGYARNARTFEDTSFMKSEIVSWTSVEQRFSTLQTSRPIRLVYCGRMERRKGVDHSVEIIAKARAIGASVEFDIIGEGEDAGLIRQLIESKGLEAHVKLLGRRVYGPLLLKELSAYDGFLFTPLGEDTPRAIFDAYAAGLPLIAYGIEYVQERARKENAAAVIKFGDKEDGAKVILDLDRNRNRLVRLSELAHRAAEVHCADNWYKQRAEWTLEAIDRHRAGQ